MKTADEKLRDAGMPTKNVDDNISVDGRRGRLLRFNHHLSMWQVRYDDEPGVYYYVLETSMETDE